MKKTIALMLASMVWLGGCSGRTDDGSDAAADELAIAAALEAVNEEIRLLTDAPSLLTGDANTATITAIVVDSMNRVVADREIQFSSDGGVLQNIISTTDETGAASAELSLAGDYRNRNITVTATMGGQSASIPVAAAGTSIVMAEMEAVVRGNTAELEFTLTAGNDQPIPNQTLTFLSSAGNPFSQNSAVTDASGVARVSVSSVAGPDIISVSALSGTLSGDFEFAVVENIQAVDKPVRIRVISNQSAIETGGNEVARITTLVTDENNRVISGKVVEFSSTGGVLQNIQSVTNEAGQADAELSLAGDYRNQDIVVSAQVDDQIGSVQVGTSGSTLSVSGPAALVSGNTAVLEITLTSGNGQPIANEIVSVSSSAGNTLSADNLTTDATGKATVTVGSTAGSDTIAVEALGTTVTKTHDILVAADILSVVAADSYEAIQVDTLTQFQVQWESSGQPVSAGRSLKFSVSAGSVRAVGSVAGSSSTFADTDANGVATVEIESTTVGPVTVTFSDSNNPDTVSQFDIHFVQADVEKIADIIVESTPASVATGNSSTILATVKDDFGNPIRGVDIEFSSLGLQGGRLYPVTAQTDDDGQARITFEAGPSPTAEKELVITATAVNNPDVYPAGFTDTNPEGQGYTRLTVTEEQLNVIIGLAGDVSEADTGTRYRKAGLVQVTDGAGRPVSDASVLVSMVPLTYIYGSLVPVDTNDDDEADRWAYGLVHVCAAEDKNRNRILDPDEDVNSNGFLDPSDPGLVDADLINTPTVISGEITTDANGVGFFSMAYPQSNGWWFDVQIIARVQALGVEAVATYDTDLEVLTEAISDVEQEPPNLVSPYGPVDLLNPPVCETP